MFNNCSNILQSFNLIRMSFDKYGFNINESNLFWLIFLLWLVVFLPLFKLCYIKLFFLELLIFRGPDQEVPPSQSYINIMLSFLAEDLFYLHICISISSGIDFCVQCEEYSGILLFLLLSLVKFNWPLVEVSLSSLKYIMWSLSYTRPS